MLAQGTLNALLTDGSPQAIWLRVHVNDITSAYLMSLPTVNLRAYGKVFTISADNYDTFQKPAKARPIPTVAKVSSIKDVKRTTWLDNCPLFSPSIEERAAS